jgi:GH24 family phage-related lysozyme (muramidase)
MGPFSEKALKLILSAEGLDQPGKWPGGKSGISIGIGYDLGYVDATQFGADWKSHFTPEHFQRLNTACGIKGLAAKAIAPRFADIHVTRSTSEKVFSTRTLPEFVAMTKQAFPGWEHLPLDAQGALVSLVYNRGPGMLGDRRKEMRAVRSAVAHRDLHEIARQIRAMKRLWVGTGQDGLLKRRDAEADLVESAIPHG